MKILCNICVLFSYSNKIINKNISLNLINNKISINDMIDELSKNIEMKNYLISYYDKDLNAFIYVGIYPLKNKIVCTIDANNKIVPIQIKLRQIINKFTLLRTELIEDDIENIDEDKSNKFINEKSKRAKERKIGDIIKKVFMWRKLFFGYKNKNGNLIKFSLEVAAEKIGISKKSLDDYLIQLRIGKMFGFNFNEHKNDKVGVLRSFVKKNKSLYDNKY